MNKATDTRPPFFIIEDSVVEDYNLNPYEGWLYVVITKHADRKTGESFPSVQTLAKETNMSKASVIRYTKSLEQKGLIRVERDTNTPGQDREVNHYWLLVATPPVSVSNRGGVSEQLPPVAVVDTNQNQLEPESIATQKEIKKALHDALVLAFGLTPEKLTRTSDGVYWKAATELAAINFPVMKVPAFHQWCKSQNWKSFTVMALAKHAPEWLASQTKSTISVLDGLRLVS
jgi:hypothetical protein